MQAVQLTLDEALVTCPRCGHEFAVDRMVRDAKVEMLPDHARIAWTSAGWRFQRGIEYLGPADLARKINKTRTSAYRALQALVDAGLVEARPQNKYRRARHLYTGKAI